MYTNTCGYDIRHKFPFGNNLICYDLCCLDVLMES